MKRIDTHVIEMAARYEMFLVIVLLEKVSEK